ncbi:putative guanine deaminase [Cladobotryum mycophilum]|uniref:Guanine deaminase n=1 Tax=Cladobotryum mycophilum TaxID=491253 RepID=A0ABR0SV70_9HYPO
MADDTKARLFHGTIIHSTSPANLHILENALLAISPPAPSSPCTQTSGQFLIPGFVDTHNHAPQWPQRGAGQGMQILDWLDEITFPNEARFRDAAYAKRTYGRLVSGMLRQGITTASYYSSLHGEGTRVLADTCLKRGQRALIGKCNMDRNSPDYYRDASAEESMQVTRDCISHIRTLDPSGQLIRPSLGALATQDPSLAIQTHFNEAQQEIDATLSLFPGFTNEADLYHSLGLLTPRSILAHCTIMTPYETQKLASLDCGVAHCPTANMTVGGGFMASPIRSFLSHGIKVGLGTDSGGGYSSSMLDSMRHSLIASYARDAVFPKATEDAAALSLEEVFYLATVGGARVVGFGDEIGNFEVGKEFDAMVVDLRDERGSECPTGR